ncbi:MAG: rod shape-determining protein RodA [Acidobacteria bacterium]|nr:MAG: rod shape-determining protein RodA [Acidobacteriota bacterium]MCE7959678.1 rod shape-determining protein RodA [Acidobacteria bacterium ACB2]
MSRLSEALPRRLDVPFLLAVLALTLVGVAMVHSTTSGGPRADLWTRQLLFAAAGLVGALVLVALDYRLLVKYAPWLFAGALLVLLYLPLFAPRIAGARSWVRLGGGFLLQPSEFAKLAVALVLARVLESDDRAFLSGRTVAVLAACVGAPVLLVLLQPDLGVALTYVPLLLSALYFGGMKGRFWAALLLSGALLAGGSWFFLKEYQKDRIRTFLDPDLEARGAGYQVRQARIAIGSGGILGKGWRKGTQSRLGFLPVRHTDFVFAALAEEWGFVGVGGVLGLFGLLLHRGLAIAREARDRGGSMLVLLIVVNLTTQALVNVAMNVGLLPTTGITLPYVSYGGSSLLACWAMAGLCLSVARRRFVNA